MKPSILFFLQFGPDNFGIFQRLSEKGKYNLIIYDQSIEQMMYQYGLPFESFAYFLDEKVFEKSKKAVEKIKVQLDEAFKDPDFQRQFSYKGVNFFPLIMEEFTGKFLRLIEEETLYIEAFQKIIGQRNLRLIVLGNDVTWQTKPVILKAKERKIPTLCLSHSSPVATSMHDVIYADKIAVYGSAAKDFYLKYNNPIEKIVITGAPKWDKYFNFFLSQSEKEKICWEIGLDTHKPIILYFTTWPQTTDVSAYCEPHYTFKHYLETLKAVKKLEKKEVQLVVKMHPGDGTSPQVYINIAKKEGVNVIVTQQYLEYFLSLSDVVISHGSNAGIEAMFLDKPVIEFFLPTLKDINRLFDPQDAVIYVFNSQELSLAIEKCLWDEKTKKELRERRKKTLYRFNYLCDGKATERFVDLVEKMVKRKE